MEKKPEKGKIPGYEPVETPKKSRRGGKKKDDPTKPGPSSNLPPPSSAQPGHEPGPSIQKPPTSIGAAQNPATTGARRPTQIPSQPSQATLPSTQPTQSLAQTGIEQSSPSSSHLDPATASKKSIKTPGPEAPGGQDKNAGGVDPTGGLQSQGLAGSTPAEPNAERSKGKESISDPANTGSEAKSQNEKHEARPGGIATQGKIVFLSTNYFKLSIRPDLKFYRYSIAVSPEAKGKKLAQMIKDALTLPEFDTLRPGIVSDFAAVLVSLHSLPDNLLEVSVPYKKDSNAKDSEDNQPPGNAKVPSNDEDLANRKCYYVKFRFIWEVNDFNVGNIQESTADQGSLPLVQDLDIVLGHYRKLSQDVAMIGKRKAFQLRNPRADEALLHASKDPAKTLLVALRGFFSSVRLSTTEILVNVNVSHGTFYCAKGLQELFGLIWDHPQVHFTKISGLLKGLRVQLMHLSPKEVFRTISGYASPGQGHGYEPHPPRVSAPGANPQNVQFFEYKSTKPAMNEKDKEKAKNGQLTAHNLSQCGCVGSYISVFDYFKRQYPLHLISETLPAVNVGSSQHPSYLPLSACFVPCQPAKLKLTPDETAFMQTFAVRVPYLNAASMIDNGFPTLGLGADNRKLSTLGITIDPNRLTLKGRTLPQPTVIFRNKDTTDKEAAYNGKSQWNLGSAKFRSTKELKTWACLNIHNGKTPQSCHDLCVNNFVNVLKACGIRASTPKTTHLKTDELKTGRFEQLDRCLGRFQFNDSDVPILLVVLPDNSSQLYNQIKQLGELKHGILTICVVGSQKKFYNTATYPKRPSDPPMYRSIQYNANVALKVNIKNDGVNHVLKYNDLGFISGGKTMVIGIDVTHPSPGSGDSATSIAAMVASSDKSLAQWPAEIRVNPARQEKVNKLHAMLRSHLLYWKEKKGSLPAMLLIYRDGVSEGQYQMVLDEELPQLRAACESVYEGAYKKGVFPRITLLIVGKRHHTRFYRADESTGKIFGDNDGKDGNPPFGTVVDTGVVDHERNWDFYLQSHTALDGTARPAHYFVLLDEIFQYQTIPNPYKNASDLLYGITYNMCYLFCRATTSVSIPPPVYYADIACERARRWNSRVFESSQSEVSEGNEIQDSDVTVVPAISKRMFYI